MTEYVLALIPTYGVYVIFLVVLIACTGIPLPSSILVLTAGGLAASGDLEIWQVLAAGILGFLVGDQLTYNLAKYFGPNLLVRARSFQRVKPLVDKSENLLEKHGAVAIFLSRTIFSPMGPFVGYISGALKINWALFTIVALFAATIWTSIYGMMGYLFAGNLPQISSMVASMLVVGVATLIAIALFIQLFLAWKKFEYEQ